MPKIAVFAGHGGSDPGAVANNLQEKDLNLALSNEVSKILRQRGYEVINNRTTDVNRSITGDAYMANRNNVDAMVEIHQNSNFGTPGSGTEAFYSVKDTGKGKALAEAINNNIAALGFPNRGIKTRTNATGEDSLGILRLTNAPSVLVETSFINNPQDMARFDVNKIATAIANGVTQVFPVSGAPSGGGTPSVPPSTPTSGDPVVRNIQSTLNQRYNAGLAVDGKAGAKTKQALVKGLQTELNRQFGANLVVDGSFGPATKAATKSFRRGTRGNIIYLIQAALYIKGYSIDPDGVFGPQTEAVVRSFQRNNGLTADGVVGPQTQYVLFR